MLMTVALSVLLGLLFVNAQVALAHDWWHWHWHKSTLHLFVFGSHQPEAVAAIAA